MRIPRVVSTQVNQGPSLVGSFIDAEWVFHVISAGRWHFVMRGERYVVEEGDLVLLPPRLLHLVRPVSRGELVHLVIHFKTAEVIPELERLPLVVQPTRPHLRESERLFQALASAHLERAPGGEWRTSGMMLELLAIYRQSSAGSFEAVDDPARRAVERAAALFQRRYADASLSLADAASAAGVTVPYLCRIFRRLTGLTPYAYLSAFRVGRARLLLGEGKLSCKEIAEATGFSDPVVFSKVFKRVEGIAPAHWARAMR